VFFAYILAAINSILFPEPPDTQVKIAQEHRMGNPDGSCFWISVTMLCKHHGITRGEHIYPENKGGAFLKDDIIPMLKDKKIRYYYHWQNKNQRPYLLKWACENKYGCVITTKEHALVVVHYDEKGVRVIDNARPKAKRLQNWSHSKFKKKWHGEVLVIMPDKPVKQH